MPKRTNEFQQLVYLIQEQLRDRPETTVTESKYLKDRNTGKKREVDIVVECTVNGVPFVIAFECHDGKRSPTIEWVERMVKKHEHLSDKLVLVANRAPSTDAVDLARREGVETAEFSVATKQNWPALIDQYTKLFFAAFAVTITSYRADYDCPDGAQRFDGTTMPDVVDINGVRASLAVFVEWLVTNGGLLSISDIWYRKPLAERRSEHAATGDYVPPPDKPIVLVQGALSYPLKKLVIAMTARIGQAALNMQHAGYNEMQVAHSSGTVVDGDLAGHTVRVVMTEQKGQLPKVAVMLRESSNADGSTVRVGELNPGTPAHLREP
jgi:hypothetical protein